MTARISRGDMGIPRIVFAALFALAGWGCHSSRIESSCARSDVLAAEYALAHAASTPDAPANRNWIVYPETPPVPAASELREASVSNALATRLTAVNARSGQSWDGLSAAGTRFVSAAERQQLFANPSSDQEHAWNEFRRVFPTAEGFITVAVPAILDDEKQAAVYLTRSSGVLGDEGLVYVLRCESGQWRRNEVRVIWVS